MNQQYLVLKATENADGSVNYAWTASLLCERSESRQCAKDTITEDGTFYCVPLGDKIVANTTRVFDGVKATRTREAKPNSKPTKKPKKPGLNPAVKVAPKPEPTYE